MKDIYPHLLPTSFMLGRTMEKEKPSWGKLQGLIGLKGEAGLYTIRLISLVHPFLYPFVNQSIY